MAKPTGLTSVFMELGLSRSLAAQAARRLDTARFNSWGEDDWASALLQWRCEHNVAVIAVAAEVRKYQRVHLIDVPGQIELF